jgi:hypothetical protein
VFHRDPLEDVADMSDIVGVSAYYARPNAIARVLPTPLRDVFLDAWAWYESQALGAAARSALAGLLANAIRAAYSTPNLMTTPALEIGDWFEYDGVAIYRLPRGGAHGRVRIKRLEVGIDITAIVRGDCMLTSTAYANMSGTRRDTLLLGVLSSDETFELVVAGYQDRMAWHGQNLSNTDWVNKVLDLIRVQPGSAFPLADVIDKAIGAIEEVIIFRHGHKILAEGSSYTDERGFQNFFRILEQWVLEPFGARLIPEADSGLGPVDFLIVNEIEAHAIEFKQVTSLSRLGDLTRALTVQLPTYMDGHGVRDGWFVILLQGSLTDEDVAQLMSALDRVNPRQSSIQIRFVDGRVQKSASLRKVVPKLLSADG